MSRSPQATEENARASLRSVQGNSCRRFRGLTDAFGWKRPSVKLPSSPNEADRLANRSIDEQTQDEYRVCE